jgi:hypothetical protein
VTSSALKINLLQGLIKGNGEREKQTETEKNQIKVI